MSWSGSMPRAGSITSGGTGRMVARLQAATPVVEKPTPPACTRCPTQDDQAADNFDEVGSRLYGRCLLGRARLFGIEPGELARGLCGEPDSTVQCGIDI